MSLSRAYGAERLDDACRLALELGAINYRSVKSILATGRDQAAGEQCELSLPDSHDNIRGPEYYARAHNASSRNGKES